MPSDHNLYVSIISTIIGVFSAMIAVFAAVIAFKNYKGSTDQFQQSQQEQKKNKKETFINESNAKLDNVYTCISEFIEEYTGSPETPKKRTARDRILYFLESIRVDIFSGQLTKGTFNDSFGSITIKVSDLTFEDNFEKTMRDLAIIKTDISNLKSKLLALMDN